MEEDLAPVLAALAGRGIFTEVMPVLKTVEEALQRSPLFLDMVHDALILHDRRGFFRWVLGAMKARLDELGSRRVYKDRRWYWILKPDFKPGEIQSYLVKARTRLLILDVLLKEDDFSDVVREAQEAVELALKAVLRSIGIEPPKWHDVGSLIVAHKRLLPAVVGRCAARMAEISKRLRKERELAFYGDIDFIPTEEYTAADAARAIRDARWIVSMAGKAVPASE